MGGGWRTGIENEDTKNKQNRKGQMKSNSTYKTVNTVGEEK